MRSDLKRIRTMVVDDEPLARRRLMRLLAARPDADVVAECRNAREALDALATHSPDVMFLDVQMPQMDGVTLLESVEPDRRPAVVFVTAFDSYAVRAFDLHAVDYLLKPYDEERFTLAFDRASERVREIGEAGLSNRLRAVVDELAARRRDPGRLVLRIDKRIVILKTSEVDWIAAEGKYVRVHVGGTSYLHREAIGSIEAQLDTSRFLRIHRSTIVNLDRVKELHDWFAGEYVVVLRGGERLTMSRRYRSAVAKVLCDRI